MGKVAHLPEPVGPGCQCSSAESRPIWCWGQGPQSALGLMAAAGGMKWAIKVGRCLCGKGTMLGVSGLVRNEECGVLGLGLRSCKPSQAMLGALWSYYCWGFASLPLKCYSHISVRPSVLRVPRISGPMGIDLVSSSTFQGGWLRSEGLWEVSDWLCIYFVG